MRILISVIILFFGVLSSSAEVLAPDITLEPIKINIHDQARVAREAEYFAKNCMMCHTMRYLVHNKVAQQAGITLDKMPLHQTTWWLDIVPPDLTLLARRRTPQWIYTYTHSFYKDPTRPTGYNNLLVPDINMPNLFAGMQGIQELTPEGKKLMAESHFRKPHYYSVLLLVKKGNQTSEAFDQTMQDLVTFFVYAAEPESSFRRHLGVWVLLFLGVFLVLTVLLKRAYWKDVKHTDLENKS